MAYSAVPIFPTENTAVRGSRILKTWVVPLGHPFVVGNVVTYSGGVTGFALGKADSLGGSQTVGVVQEIGDETVTVVYQGEIDFSGYSLNVDDGNTSLTAGTVYYLSPTNSGYIAAVRPSDGLSFVQPVMVATDSKKAVVVNSLSQASSSASLFSPVGTMLPWAGGKSTVPTTWRMCDGEAVRKTAANPSDNVDYSTLYSVVGDKYRVTGIASSTTGPSGNAYRDLIVSFSAEGHEDYTPTSTHGLVSAYSSDTYKDYKIGWGGTNDFAVASLTAASSGTVRFQFRSAYPGTSVVNFLGAAPSSIVTVQSLSTGEVSGYTSQRFFIPDMRGRTVFGVGYSSGLSELNRGQVGGDDTHLLTTDEIPDHNNKYYASQSVGSGGAGTRTTIDAGTRNTDIFSTLDAAYTADNTAISLMPPYVAANWIIRHRQFEGVGIEVGPQGAQGTTGAVGSTGDIGSTGATGRGVQNLGLSGNYLVGEYVFADGTTQGFVIGVLVGVTGTNGSNGSTGPTGPTPPIIFSGQPTMGKVFFAPESNFKDGILGNPAAGMLSPYNLSTDVLFPTDFTYGMSVLSATGVAPQARGAFYFRDPANIPNEYTYTYGSTEARPPNPNEPITRGTVNNLSIIENGAEALGTPLAIILTPGIYTLDKPWFNHIGRDLYIGAENNTVVTQTVQGVTILPLYLSTGATSLSGFSMRLNIGTGQSMVAATGSAVVVKPPFTIVNGLTGAFGLSASIDGMSAGVGGFFNRLAGAYVVKGISGSTMTVDVRNEAGFTFNGYLNTTYSNYLNTLDVYRVTVHTTSQGGALFTDRNTRTFVGDWSLLGTDMDGIALVNDAGVTTLADPSLSGTNPNGQWSNATAIQTDGGIIRARGCAIIGYPVAAHAYNGGSITLGHCAISNSYYGFALDSGANGRVEGTVVSHTAIPIIAENAANLTVTHDLVKGGKTALVANKGSICAINTNLEVGSTNILGAGIFGENANVKVKPSTRILAALDTTKGTVGDVGAVFTNFFAVLGINSNISTPDMYGALGVSATDIVTKMRTSKFSGQGTLQGINSKIVATYDKTQFSPVVDAVSDPAEVIKGNSFQIPLQ
jgi:microcystin-dependent protein